MTNDYLLEVLLEEIPAWMLGVQLDTLHEQLAALYRDFTARQPDDGEVSTDATSRRIVAILRSVPDRQPDTREQVKGPPARAAYAADGSPTAALNGFVKKNAASIGDVSLRDDYVWIERTVTGATVDEFLALRIPQIIEDLRWPKTMRWGDGDHLYIRPVHSVISIYGDRLLPLAIFDVGASRTTYGHRTHAPQAIEVSSASEYVKKLEAAEVIVSSDDRVDMMRAAAVKLASEVGGAPSEDEAIWDQWRFLTEFPGVVRGEFRSDFLELPREVLVTVMRVHQKQLPIERGDKLSNHFLAVMDAPADPAGNAAAGNSFVTNARFADAAFFYESDRKRPLDSRVDELARLQFHARLGTYLQKVERLERLADAICGELHTDSAAARTAARLCKADLVTEMVKEFTDLQGQIGGIYAREDGHPDEIWQAIYDHYLPLSAGGELPRNQTGAVVALADKLDTIAGFFSQGIRPSGSKDPFALRRAGQGIVLLLLEEERWSVDVAVDRLVDLALAEFGSTSAEARNEILGFLAERVRNVLEQHAGFAYDEIAAAMSARWMDSVTDLHRRVIALAQVRSRPDFLSLLDSAKRIENILGDRRPEGTVDEGLLEHETERRLAAVSALAFEQISELSEQREYGLALESFAALAPELERFFVDVMVMVDDPEVRQNRLALLQSVGSMAKRIADVTKVVIDRRDYAAAE